MSRKTEKKTNGKSKRKSKRRSVNTKRKTQKCSSFRKTPTRRFFSGGAYSGPPYPEADVRLDPRNQIVDSRLLPAMQGGEKRKSKKQKGGFYGIDMLKSLSSIYPYPLSNPTGATGLPSVGRILGSEPIQSIENMLYKEKYLV